MEWNTGTMEKRIMSCTERSQFGIEVKIELIKQGMTSRQLARKLGMADSTICDVLYGRNTCQQTKQKILDVLEEGRREREQKEAAQRNEDDQE